MWNEIQKQFPVNEKYIWLNNCGISVMSKAVHTELQKYNDAFLADSVKNHNFTPLKMRQRITGRLGELFNTDENNYALVQNTAEALNYIAYGLELNKGDEVILLENEYPSNVYPWRVQAKKRGVVIQFIPQKNSSEEFLQDLNKAITDKTKVISLSAVHWLTGLPYPLHEVGKICKEKNIIFCLDAAQGAGHVPIDPEAMNISFMAFSAWKWLMGPLGMGVLYIAPKALSLLEPVLLSTGSVTNDSEYLPYRDEYKPDASRYEISTSNYTAWCWFAATMDFLGDIGFNEVQNRIYELARELAGMLSSGGFTPVLNRYTDTGIVTVKHPDANMAELWQALAREGIITALRDGGIRMAPHIFISEEQLERVARMMKNFV